MICLRRIFERLAAFVGGPQDCRQQIAVEFEAVQAGADVLGAVHRSSSLVSAKRFFEYMDCIGAFSQPPEQTFYSQSLLLGDKGNRFWMPFNVSQHLGGEPRHAAILSARSCKRNSPLVPIYAGGNS
jgi:hypothetical protein